MCDEVVHDSLAAAELIPVWYGEMIETLYTALYADEKNVLYFDENSDNIVFFCDKMGILNIGPNNIILDNNFDEDDPDAIIL